MPFATGSPKPETRNRIRSVGIIYPAVREKFQILGLALIATLGSLHAPGDIPRTKQDTTRRLNVPPAFGTPPRCVRDDDSNTDGRVKAPYPTANARTHPWHHGETRPRHQIIDHHIRHGQWDHRTGVPRNRAPSYRATSSGFKQVSAPVSTALQQSTRAPNMPPTPDARPCQ